MRQATRCILATCLFALLPSGVQSAPPTAADSPTHSQQRVGYVNHPGLSRDAAAVLPADAVRAFKEIARSPTQAPILLPERSALLRSAQVTFGPSWHGVSMQTLDYSVYVHASARAISVPGIRRPPVRIPSLKVPRISRTHDIVTAHFVAWGVAWDVDIECMGGVEHALCADDVLVHAFIRSLKRLEPSP